ncbi:MAG: hypothetical protein PWQ88_178 [Candidatus Methanomethylophilaceae archaeon]|nr:hypothetical protein [Candidatus Methanomethylophilaceae archaeon]MDI3541683.1 hypothetical protein [Candidatus Methanomethylophilaceae archaeon]
MNKEEILNGLSEAVILGKPDQARSYAQRSIDEGIDPLDAINNGLVKGMSVVGDRYAAREVYLPQVLMSANTMYAGLDILLPMIPSEELEDKKKVAIGVVEGDVHDIGKNIVKTMMTAGGFEVKDLGRDVPIETFISVAESIKTDVVAMSTLMTPTMDGMKDVIDGLIESGYRSKVKVVIGGPPTSPEFAEEIGADHRDANAQDSVAWLKEALF